MRFQSSPGPKAGCYLDLYWFEESMIRVSILTRPESRMLHGTGKTHLLAAIVFQSSPGPKAGCYLTVPSRICT